MTLSFMSDDNVELVVMNKDKGWGAIDVEFENKYDFRPPLNPIQSAFTSAGNDQATPSANPCSLASATMIEDLFVSKYRVPMRPKDIVFEMSEQHSIHLSYKKAYMSKEHALNQFYVLEQANHRIVKKIKNDSENRFKYGFMEIGVSIEGFNSVIRPIICIDATYLKARINGVLLVAVFKDGNEMIYPLAFGFTNFECTESWIWFLKKLHKVIKNPDSVMLVIDWHIGIFNAMEAIFPDATHGVCAYHLAQNLKRFCKQRNDVVWLYYRAVYAYRMEEFECVMGQKKTTCLEPSSSTSKPGKKPRSCSICKKEGHHRLKYLDKAPVPTFIDIDEEKADGPAVI
ncbi:hypothetical protein Ddye_015494 [Dipteronia dyeriana]|uniref:MULE transposase domain-containing protein n=1 Tax=Dipteronia dyeriana TaxID=168575 RepID=A0AAD9U4W8_9ROSI|nr:hypothetical protein Ddye_015494 [Dipteronia dyeriana]